MSGRRENREEECGEKDCFHKCLRLVSGYVSRWEGEVSMEMAISADEGDFVGGGGGWYS